MWVRWLYCLISANKELGAQPGEGAGTATGNQQERKVHQNTGASSHQHGYGDLPDVVQDRAQNTADPERALRNQVMQRDHTGQAEQAARRAVHQGHHISAKDSAQNDARHYQKKYLPGPVAIHRIDSDDIGKTQLYTWDGDRVGDLTLHHEDGQGNSGQQRQLRQSFCFHGIPPYPVAPSTSVSANWITRRLGKQTIGSPESERNPI